MGTGKWCVIDAEGDVGNKGLLGVAFYSDITQAYHTDFDSIKAILHEHAEMGYTFLCHNATYDIPVIFWQLRIPVKIVYYNDRFNRGEWKYNKAKPPAEIWDTVGLSGGLSLAALGKAMGLEKYETPFKLLGEDRDTYRWKCAVHNEWECIECYAVRDAEIVYKFMKDFETLLNGWDVKPKRRLAGIAMDAWKVLDTPDPISIGNPKIRALGRESYAGGRVETYGLGHFRNIYAADVCSMYPSVMAETSYPSPDGMIYLTSMRPGGIEWNFEGVADVDISVPYMYLPPLPYTHRGERLYPCGRLRGQWTFLELRYAMSLGCIINYVHRAAFSMNSLRPFSGFVGTLWELRQAYENRNDPRSLFAKLLMNNLYGRIGMRDDLVRRDVFEAPDRTGGKDWKGKEPFYINRRIFLEEERGQNFKNKFANVIWAAYTTAAARVKLHKYMLLQGSALVYCDTDSVFSTAPIAGLGEGLGALRDEEHFEEAIIAQPKLYAVKHFTYDMPEVWRYEPCRKHGIRSCDDCRWKAKAKGVPRDLALEFLRSGQVEFSMPVKPLDQQRKKTEAGTWVPVTRTRHAVPHRRQPTDPLNLQYEYGWSGTTPPIVGPLALPRQLLP